MIGTVVHESDGEVPCAVFSISEAANPVPVVVPTPPAPTKLPPSLLDKLTSGHPTVNEAVLPNGKLVRNAVQAVTNAMLAAGGESGSSGATSGGTMQNASTNTGGVTGGTYVHPGS